MPCWLLSGRTGRLATWLACPLLLLLCPCLLPFLLLLPLPVRKVLFLLLQLPPLLAEGQGLWRWLAGLLWLRWQAGLLRRRWLAGPLRLCRLAGQVKVFIVVI